MSIHCDNCGIDYETPLCPKCQGQFHRDADECTVDMGIEVSQGGQATHVWLKSGDVRGYVDNLRKQLADANNRLRICEINDDMSTGIFNEIGEMLEGMGCSCGEQQTRENTPPMFYREWILCVMKKRVADAIKKNEPTHKE